jgi:hypothetical protein
VSVSLQALTALATAEAYAALVTTIGSTKGYVVGRDRRIGSLVGATTRNTWTGSTASATLTGGDS